MIIDTNKLATTAIVEPDRQGVAVTKSGRAFLLHSLHVPAARTVKYVEVRQLLEVFNVPHKLHRGAALRACGGNRLVSVGHDQTLARRRTAQAP
jgi:hypothetical protein